MHARVCALLVFCRHARFVELRFAMFGCWLYCAQVDLPAFLDIWLLLLEGAGMGNDPPTTLHLCFVLFGGTWWGGFHRPAVRAGGFQSGMWRVWLIG